MIAARPSTVVSSSANAPDVLKAAGLLDRFVTVVDGAVAKEQELPGKPQPDTYEYAADELGVPRDRSVVVEDAVSGAIDKLTRALDHRLGRLADKGGRVSMSGEET